MLEGLDVMDPATMTPVPPDGKSSGEVMLRGNMVVKGYMKNPKATQEAFAGGWFHSGDVAVKHPDGYIEIKVRDGEHSANIADKNVFRVERDNRDAWNTPCFEVTHM